MEPYLPYTPIENLTTQGKCVKNENIPPKNKFLFDLQSKVDNYIGKEIFVPIWTAILRDCEVKEWKDEGNNTFRLILDSAYQAEPPSKIGQTLLIEKEIVMQILPNCSEIIFPKVKDLFDSKIDIDPQNKELNAIWGWVVSCGLTYTGVGYSQRWNNEENIVVNDNVNDASFLFQYLATPRCLTLQDTIREWNERGREKIL